jgi:hypothetical protein
METSLKKWDLLINNDATTTVAVAVAVAVAYA